MAIYTTVEKLDNQISYIGTATAITSAQKAGFIEDAEAIINGSIANKYTVPFSSNNIPPLIEAITVDIAAYRAIRFLGLQDDDYKNIWHDRFKECKQLLSDIAKGTMFLVSSTGTVVSQITTYVKVTSNTKDYKPIFDTRESINWRVDPDLIDAEDDKDS